MKIKANDIIIELPVKEKYFENQTHGIKFVATHSILTTSMNQICIDKYWSIRDYKTGIAICNGKILKETRLRFFKMIDNKFFIKFYNLLIKDKEILNE